MGCLISFSGGGSLLSNLSIEASCPKAAEMLLTVSAIMPSATAGRGERKFITPDKIKPECFLPSSKLARRLVAWRFRC
jgi:hypothetical protein